MSDDPRPPLTTTVSLKPAAVVLVVAALTLVTFLIVDVAVSQSPSTTTTVPVIVGGLGVDPDNAPIAQCQTGDIPPSNISGSFVLPAQTIPAGAKLVLTTGPGEYDCQRTFSTVASPSNILGFYQAQLQARGWNIFSRGTSNGGGQLLFQKNGSDTFLWVLGITINAHVGTSTRWTYRLYQDSDGV